MNRRKFLSWLGVGTAVAATAPMALLAEGPACVAPIINGPLHEIPAVIGEYNDYSNFSSFAIAQSIDQSVINAAREFAYRTEESVRCLTT